ncbi:hypothetical protein IW262DRAFT_1293689 [Armillaria fumosa]|nr:hypothetical protein IW262DRAFT_1293689 [Armillaria fumosa]
MESNPTLTPYIIPGDHTSLHHHLATVPVFWYGEKGSAVRGHLSLRTPTPQHPLDIAQLPSHRPPTGALPLAGGLNVGGDGGLVTWGIYDGRGHIATQHKEIYNGDLIYPPLLSLLSNLDLEGRGAHATFQIHPVHPDPAPPLPAVESSSKGKGKGKTRVTALPALAALAPASPVIDTTSNQRLASKIVDNTIYARGFHPNIDLQFHEPPSCEALEHMKMSLLPAAPESLTKPPSQIRSGREYVYHCHSDPNPYFIWAPLLNWPCFNCTLAGIPDNVATLLDPLTLSGDGAIFWGLSCIDHINHQLDLLGQVVNQLCTDCEQVISELADGLDAISSHEHGKDIIDAYADVSDFLKSFIIRPGESASQPHACGSIAACMSDKEADGYHSSDDD